MQLKKSIFLGISSLGLIAGAAQAQKAGDTVGYIGGSYIQTNSSLSAPNSTGPNAGLFNAITQGASGSVQNGSMVTFSVLQMFTDNIGAELAAGYPPALNLNLNLPNNIGYGTNGTYTSGATTNAWAPTVYAKYFFNKPEDQFRPYVGAGVNYTWFSNSKVSSNPVTTALGGGGVSLSSSWNPAVTIGAIYNINSNWSLRGNVDYIPISTNATFTSGSSYAGVPISGNTTTTKITVNPVLMGLSLGYKF